MGTSRSTIEVILKGTDQSMTASLRGATAETKGFTGALSNLKAGYVAVAAATAGITAGLGRIISSAVRGASEIKKFHDRIGASVEGLQFLKFAAEQSNVAFGQVTLGLQRMTRRISEAAQGMGEAKGAIKELGLNAKELNKLLPDEQIRVVAERLATVKDQADKVRLAFKLFDSEGVGLIQMFDDLGPAMQAAFETAGGAASEETITRLDRAGQAWARLGHGLARAGQEAAVIASAPLTAAVLPPTEKQAQAELKRLADLEATGFGGPDAPKLAQQMLMAQKMIAEGSVVPVSEQFRQVHQELEKVRSKHSEVIALGNLTADQLQRFYGAVISAIDELPIPAPEMISETGDAMDGVTDSAQTMVDIIRSDVDPATADLAQRMMDLGHSTEEVWQNLDKLTPAGVRIAEWAKQVEDDVTNAGAAMIDIGAQAAMSFADATAAMLVQGQSMAQSLRQIFRKLVQDIIAYFARIAAIKLFLAPFTGGASLFTPIGGGGFMASGGGVVRAAGGLAIPGYGGGDRVPAILEQGEVVLNKQTVSAMGMSNLMLANATRGQSIPALGGGGGGGGGNVTLNINARTTFGGRGEGMAIARQVVTLAKEAGAL